MVQMQTQIDGARIDGAPVDGGRIDGGRSARSTDPGPRGHDRRADELGYRVFDADNHFFEGLDAPTRHLDPAFAERGIGIAEVDGRFEYVVRGEVKRTLFGPGECSRPGDLQEFFFGNPQRRTFEELVCTDWADHCPEAFDRELRLRVMDDQGVESAWLFPSGAVTWDGWLQPDLEASRAVHRALNRWVEEEWGFAHAGRIFAAACIPIGDVEWAVEELEWCLERGARIVNLGYAPIPTRDGRRSPGDSRFDPFWARCQEAGVVVTLHLTSQDGYDVLHQLWEPESSVRHAFTTPLAQVVRFQRSIADYLGAMVCHGVFERFRELRVAAVEHGASWVPDLVRRLAKADSLHPGRFTTPAVDQFREHVWVTPFFEDDVAEIARFLPVERLIMGSDWPHAEGPRLPLDFLDRLTGLDAASVRRIVRDNARELTGRA